VGCKGGRGRSKRARSSYESFEEFDRPLTPRLQKDVPEDRCLDSADWCESSAYLRIRHKTSVSVAPKVRKTGGNLQHLVLDKLVFHLFASDLGHDKIPDHLAVLSVEARQTTLELLDLAGELSVRRPEFVDFDRVLVGRSAEIVPLSGVPVELERCTAEIELTDRVSMAAERRPVDMTDTHIRTAKESRTNSVESHSSSSFGSADESREPTSGGGTL
jgi:hypothetical protein